MLRVIILAFLLSTSFAQAQGQESGRLPTPLEMKEWEQSQDEALRTVEKVRSQLGAIVAKKEGQCLKAVGEKIFCKCIAEHMPMGLGFVEYVSIASTTKEEMHYAKLSKDDKAIVDNARKARDECALTE